MVSEPAMKKRFNSFNVLQWQVEEEEAQVSLLHWTNISSYWW